MNLKSRLLAVVHTQIVCINIFKYKLGGQSAHVNLSEPRPTPHFLPLTLENKNG